ncbi:TPA_asm: hypothetical protein CBHJFHIM_00051 [Methanobrevibacter gottschalkii virus vir075]|uniref:Uncharacterized protein n=1 Tax=Methanobrevibacter gottschalkii TaxID=190974 RepID=A0A1H7ICN2_9EURY|nr:hypothetical protein [Methanobrevibacter gottschalkii]SEK59290.1 hypothetical protein SAMN05216439_1183 [Methanobrevibacter gottschalkii]
MVKRLIGTGTTDENGRFTVSYNGKGTGKLQLKAEHEDVQSETYNITDCLYYDHGTLEEHNDIWSVSGATGNLERTSEGTVLTGNWGHFFVKHILDYFLNQPVAVDVDIVNIQQPGHARFQLYDGTNNFIRTFSELGITNNSHLYVRWEDSTIRICVNDELKVTAPVNLNKSRVGFQTYHDLASITFKNFMIYPI